MPSHTTHHTTHTTKRLSQVSLHAVKHVAMSVNGELVGATSARRRRERRLRSWWRHEVLSVAAALATARHHSAGPEVVTRREGQPEEVEVEQHDGLRGVPLDPGLPVVGAVTVGYVAAPGPFLAPPVLAGDDGLDESALAFLVQQTLLAREKEEAEAVEAAELAELAANLARTEERIVEEIDRLRVLRDRSDLTQLWNRCCRWWYLQRAAVKKLKEKRKKKRKKRLRRWRRSWSWS